ncbi:MAG: HAMP domain-containing sensor histidine kinase [Bdellovibrionota bacterium]
MEKNKLFRSGDVIDPDATVSQHIRTQLDPKAQDALLEEETAHLETKVQLSARDELLKLVSHDLRNPLTAISMGLEILIDKLHENGSDSAEILEVVNVIQRNAANINSLITDLAVTEKSGTNKVKINPCKESVAHLLRECQTLFAHTASKQNVILQIEPGDETLFAKIDHDRIMQVLSSVFRSSFKYARPGGKISLDAYSMGRDIEFVVADTGSGVQVDEPFKIFDKVSQLVKTTRKNLGLGLYIAKWIIEAHEGRFTIKSQVGQGTTYTFTVPLYHSDH